MPESTIHMILAAVERLAPEDCGAFVVEVEDANVGTVFVERNQVCWAAHTGLNRRLRTLLRESLAREDLKTEAMKRALRQHTIESLIAMPQEQGERIDWIGREQSFQPRFTFSPAELMVGVNAMLYATEAAGADLAVSMLDMDARVATFVQGDGGGLVAIRMSGPSTTIADLDELGSWAEAAFGVTRGFSREVMRRAIEAATGQVCVAWQTSRVHTHATVIERDDAERLVSTLDSRKFPTVVSRRADRSSLAVRDGLGTVASNP